MLLAFRHQQSTLEMVFARESHPPSAATSPIDNVRATVHHGDCLLLALAYDSLKLTNFPRERYLLRPDSLEDTQCFGSAHRGLINPTLYLNNFIINRFMAVKLHCH